MLYVKANAMEKWGVPISFLDKHSPEQFEIVGNGGSYKGEGSVAEELFVPCSQTINVERKREKRRRREKERTENAARYSRESSFAGCRKCSGVLGVPISFLDKFCPEQFRIIGLAAGNIKGLAGIVSSTGSDGPYIGGKLRYGRVFIQKV